MATFRVPWPDNAEKRRDLFERAANVLQRHGSYNGTPDAGSFSGTTPIGAFSGIYYSPEGADFLEIELRQKPWLVPVGVVEAQVRKLLSSV